VEILENLPVANPEHIRKLLEGVESWNTWRDENPSIISNLEGAFLVGAVLRWFNLERAFLFLASLHGADLSFANLEGALLRQANLQEAKLIAASLLRADLLKVNLHRANLTSAIIGLAVLGEANLREADLSFANLEKTNLRFAHLENAECIGADFASADLEGAHLMGTRLTGARLTGASLHRANLRGAILARAQLVGANFCQTDLTDTDVTDVTYLDYHRIPQIRVRGTPSGAVSSFWHRVRNNPIPFRKRVMRGRYQGIRGLSSSYGNSVFVRDASDQDYLDTVEDHLHSRIGRFAFWIWGLFDYGRSLMSVAVFAAVLIYLFGLAYQLSPRMLCCGNHSSEGFTPYYFSIVTYTTLGFGDVRPSGLEGEIFVSVEVILGYVTLGLLLAVLGDRIARRS
jgi:uncharacterized protein YjbI with pentapeptide repeats